MSRKPANPVLHLPSRTAGSVRRTQSLQILPVPDWDSALHLTGIAQDSVVGADGSLDPRNPVTIEVDIDAASRIAGLTGTLDPGIAEALVGAPAAAGFRAAFGRLGPDVLDPSSPLAALFDDLPVVRLISGYALLMKRPMRMGSSSGQLNICRGWAVGDTAHRLAAAGEPIVGTTTPAPALRDMLAEPDDVHPEPPVRPDSMARRRILEISRDGTGYSVYEYFRDSYVDPDGEEGSLHEYVVRARIDADLRIASVDVEPRALPFPECPLAAANAPSLVGSFVVDAHRSVRTLLSGTSGCTHLSDTLRFLRFLEPLSRLLPDDPRPVPERPAP